MREVVSVKEFISKIQNILRSFGPSIKPIVRPVITPKIACSHLEGDRIETYPVGHPDILVAYPPSSWTLFRQIEIPPVKKSEVEQVVFSLLEGALSIPLAEYQMAWKIDEGLPQTVSCFLIEKEQMASFVDQITRELQTPVALFPKAFAIAEMLLEQANDIDVPVIVLDFDATEVTCALVQRGTVLDTRSVATPISPDSTIEAAWPQFQEIARIIMAWQEKQILDATTQLLFTGSHARHLKTVVADFLHRSVVELASSEVSVSQGAIRLLEKVGFYDTSLSFRDSSIEKAKRRQWLPVSVLLVSAALLSAFLVNSIGVHFLNNRIAVLQKEYVELLHLVNVPTPEEVPQTLEGLSNRLTEFDELFFTKDAYPHTPDLPSVSKTLEWLSGMAIKASEGKTSEGKANEGGDAPLELSTFNYTVVRRPDKAHPRERYQVRVDIEFSAPTAAKARRFHELLLSADSLVDTKQEVKWSLIASKWRASFFLKDATTYLPEGGVV